MSEKPRYIIHWSPDARRKGNIALQWPQLEAQQRMRIVYIKTYFFSLLFGGTTVHSAFCIPANANLNPSYMPQIGPLTLRFAKLKLAQIIIIDEVTMMHKALLNVLDRTLRWIKKNDKPFGGVVLVLGGDWKQLLPVVKSPFDSTLYAQIEACLQSDQVYASFEHIVLTENMRAKADPKFVDFIERV